MIIEFTVENFGCINKPQTLSFEPAPLMPLSDYYVEKCGKYEVLKLALIYGANAAGKSTLLRALDFLHSLVLYPLSSKNEQFDDIEPFRFTDEVNPNTVMTLVYVYKETKYRYCIKLNKRYIVSESLEYVNPENSRDVYSSICSRATDAEKQTVTVEAGSSFRTSDRSKALNSNILWNTTLFSSFLKSNIDFPELKNATDWFIERLMPVISTKANLRKYTSNKIKEIGIDAVVSIMKKADFSIEDIELEEKEVKIPAEILSILKAKNEMEVKDSYKDIQLRFRHKVGEKNYRLDYEEESDGTKKFFNLSSILYQLVKSNPIVMIDELESSLHPDLYEHFILTHLKQSNQSQLIVATHNREFLAERNILRNDVVWFVEKNALQETEVFSLVDFGSDVVRKTSNVFNAYKIGKFGAKPNIIDHEI